MSKKKSTKDKKQTPTEEPVSTTPVDLVAAKKSLDAQVAAGIRPDGTFDPSKGISGEQANAEYERLKGVAQKQGKAVSGLVGADANAATLLSNQLFPEGSLGRVSTGFDANGNRIFENQDILDRYKGIASHYFENPLSDSEKDYTQTLKDRSKGYTTDEMQGMREQSNRASNTALSTSLAELAKTNARNGVRGAAGGRMNEIIASQYGRNTLQNEQNLQVKNADEATKRLGLYGEQVNTNATNSYNRIEGSLGSYNTALTARQQDELGRQNTNLSQVAAEKAGQYGSYFGGLNLGLANKQAADTKSYNDEMLKIAKKGYKV